MKRSTLTIEELEALATAAVALPSVQSAGCPACETDGCFGDPSSCSEKYCRPND